MIVSVHRVFIWFYYLLAYSASFYHVIRFILFSICVIFEYITSVLERYNAQHVLNSSFWWCDSLVSRIDGLYWVLVFVRQHIYLLTGCMVTGSTINYLLSSSFVRLGFWRANSFFFLFTFRLWITKQPGKTIITSRVWSELTGQRYTAAAWNEKLELINFKVSV